MLTHHCTTKVDCGDLQGAKIDESYYDLLIPQDTPADVFKPDGTPLLKYRPSWFGEELSKSVLPTCRRAATLNDNRGTAAGDIALTPVRNPSVVGWNSDRGNHYKEVKRDVRKMKHLEFLIEDVRVRRLHKTYHIPYEHFFVEEKREEVLVAPGITLVKETYHGKEDYYFETQEENAKLFIQLFGILV